MTELIGAIMAIAAALALSSLLLPVAARLRVPHTVLLAVLGVALGFAVDRYGADAARSPVLGEILGGLARIGQSAEAFLYIFLPPLLFTAGLGIDVRRLWDEIAAVLLLAIVAVLVCIGMVGGALHLVTGLNLFVCLLLGAVISTTDPAAVIGVLRDVGAPRRLTILAEGEALFNDAAAIATFGVLVAAIASRVLPDATAPGFNFLREFAGGVILGHALARIAIVAMARLGESHLGVTSVTVGLAYAAYIAGDHYLHVSGVVAVVSAALTVAALAPTRLQPRATEAIRETWHQLEFWANSLIFLFAAIVATQLLNELRWAHWLALGVVYVAAFAARGLVLFGLMPGLEALRLVQPIDRRYRTMILWGGLRGAVTLALALVAFANQRLPAYDREYVAIVATLFVLATLFVNAPTLRPMMRLFRLGELDHAEQALGQRVVALSSARVAHEVAALAPMFGGASKPPAEPASLPDLDLPLERRLAFALRALAVRERELYLEHFEHRTVSRRAIATLVTDIDRLIDRVQTSGPAGYAFALSLPNRVDPGFRAALWLHHRLGWDRWLASKLADKFETLMVGRLVLAELGGFVAGEIGVLFGADAASDVAARLAARVEATDRAVKALSVRYGAYADAVRGQHLELAAVRLERAQYDRHRDNSTIGAEIHDDLVRRLDARREIASRRPPLRLGAELASMIGRVPLFAGLDGAEVAAIGERLRARVVAPGRKIVARGGRGDGMYFVTAGSAVVKLPDRDVTLREGDFFGEMALLDDRPRNADVLADGFCHLLALDRRDFEQLLASHPSLRAEIEAVAAGRRGATASRE